MTLRECRLKLQITTGDMAKRLGIKPSELCEIEKGKRADEELLPKIKELYQIHDRGEFFKTLSETGSCYEKNSAEDEYLLKILKAIPDDLKKGEVRVLNCPLCLKLSSLRKRYLHSIEKRLQRPL